MTDRPMWVFVLQFVLGGVAMAVATAWLSRTRMAPADMGDRLTHPTSILIVGIGGAGFFGALVVLTLVYPGVNPSPIPTILFAGFVLMGLAVIVDYFRSRHVITADGLQYGRMLGPGGLARWTEVRQIRYSESMRWFRLDLTDGRAVRVSSMLQGLPRFAAEVLQRVPASALDGNTRAILTAAAAGDLPPIMG